MLGIQKPLQLGYAPGVSEFSELSELLPPQRAFLGPAARDVIAKGVRAGRARHRAPPLRGGVKPGRFADHAAVQPGSSHHHSKPAPSQEGPSAARI